MRKRTKNGDTARRIYKLLHRNPDLTTSEIAAHLPHLTHLAVQTMVSRMYKRGEIDSRGKKTQLSPSGRWGTHNTYHVKYKARSAPKPKPKPKPKPEPKPISAELQKLFDEWVEEPDEPVTEAPKPAWQPLPAISEPEGPATPVAEREVLIMRHLTDIYKAMALMTEQQDTLIEVLKGTLMDLAETKEELDRERQRRNWWDRLKDLF